MKVAKTEVARRLDAIRIPAAVQDLGSVVAMQVEVRGVCATCAQAKTAEAPTKESQHHRTERSRK
jgi:hypothetical protein